MLFKANLTDQVYILLRDKILQRELVPGERVNIDALALEFGISRTPIRDALSKLATEGLITVLARRATFVSRVSAKEFVDLLDLRLGLELWAARLSIDTIDAAALQYLDGLHRQMMDLVAELEKGPYQQYMSFVNLNQSFHGTIVQAGGNEKLLEIYRSIDSAAQIQRVIFPVPKETLQRSNVEHSQIIEALRTRHWPSLEQAITTHVGTVKQDVLQSLELWEERPGALNQ